MLTAMTRQLALIRYRGLKEAAPPPPTCLSAVATVFLSWCARPGAPRYQAVPSSAGYT